MTERFTDCSAPGTTAGVADYGRKTRPEMIAQYRAFFEHQRDEAERALAVPDEDLVVTTYLGSFVRKNRQVVTQ